MGWWERVGGTSQLTKKRKEKRRHSFIIIFLANHRRHGGCPASTACPRIALAAGLVHRQPRRPPVRQRKMTSSWTIFSHGVPSPHQPNPQDVLALQSDSRMHARSLSANESWIPPPHPSLPLPALLPSRPPPSRNPTVWPMHAPLSGPRHRFWFLVYSSGHDSSITHSGPTAPR